MLNSVDPDQTVAENDSGPNLDQTDENNIELDQISENDCVELDQIAENGKWCRPWSYQEWQIG